MARSGTSWVGKMLVASGRFGYVHEPFNPTSPPGTVRVPTPHWYTYVSEANEQSVLPGLTDALAFRFPLAQELARCRRPADLLRTARTWRHCIRSRNLRPLVKEPYAVLSAEWFARRLRSQIVITVRHPAAVVSSWARLGWNFDFADLLAQPLLLDDGLEPFREEMTAVMAPGCDAFDRVALLWRIIYTVVAQYASRSPELVVVRHEDLSRQPAAEFEALYRRLGLAYTAQAAAAVMASSHEGNPAEAPVRDAYRTALNSASNVDNWRKRLARDEIARIKRATEPAAAHYYSQAEWES
jgi:hypothetical protein